MVRCPLKAGRRRCRPLASARGIFPPRAADLPSLFPSRPVRSGLPLPAAAPASAFCLPPPPPSKHEQAGGVTSSLFCLGICPSPLILLINRALFIRGGHTDTYAYNPHQPAYNSRSPHRPSPPPPPFSCRSAVFHCPTPNTSQLLTSSMFRRLSPSVRPSFHPSAAVQTEELE